MDWKETYQSKLVTADEAVKLIKSGDRVVFAHAAGEPMAITDAMVRNAQAYKDVEVIQLVPMGKCGHCRPEMAEHFRMNAMFLGAGTRDACNDGRGDITPVFFYKVPEVLATTCPPDVALIQVSPPDAHGYCSLGVSVDYTLAAAKLAKTVLAQVNKNMPRTHGDSFLHVSELTRIVEEDIPMPQLAPPKITKVEEDIGRHCASLIKDGDCLQLGIGAIPDAVLLFLKDKKHLGIHSEMFSDGVVELVEAGVIDNTMKNFHQGKCIATFLMGTDRLYDYVNDNPAVEMYPVDYVNDPCIIAKNDNLVSINSCIQVDLMGQVVSSCIGDKQITGVGGQVDFVRGATMSKGGRSIIAMPSTVKGKMSKIVPNIDPGAAVTTSRYDVQYIVTEFGIADLRGATLRERAIRLIKIAHPDFRPELIAFFEKRFNCKFPD